MKILWAAQYTDGTVVNQFGPDGVELSYDNLKDRDSIASFALWDQATRRPILTLHLEPGQKLIYRRRVSISQGRAAPDPICHLVGWRRTVNGECIQSIAYVFEDSGRIEMAGKFNEKHPWFYSPKLRVFEE